MCWGVENRRYVHGGRSGEGVHGAHYLLLNGGREVVKLAGADAVGEIVEGGSGKHPIAVAVVKARH